jgi:hypothetical protein
LTEILDNQMYGRPLCDANDASSIEERRGQLLGMWDVGKKILKDWRELTQGNIVQLHLRQGASQIANKQWPRSLIAK